MVIAATTLLVLTAPVLLELLTPDGYGGTELIIALVASATVAQAPYFVSVVVLMERRNTKMIALASLVGALVNLALNLTLIPVYGLEAAAASTAVAYVLHAALIIRWVERTLGTSMHLLVLGLVWVAALAVLVAASQLPDSELGMAMRVMVAIPVCAGAFLAIRWLLRNFRAGQDEAAF